MIHIPQSSATQASATQAPETQNKKSFEQLLQEIESLVSAMEGGELSLDTSIQSYETGMNLIQTCTQKLLQAEKSIKILETKLNAEPEEQDFQEHQKDDGSETLQSFEQRVQQND